MFVFTSTNPCNCRSSHIPSEPPCEDICNCLQLCDIVIASNSDDAVAQCGGEKILDLTDTQYGNDTCACGDNTKKWYVKSFDHDVFETVTLSLDGTTFNAITVSGEVSVFHSDIIIYFVCGNLSYYFTIKLGIKHPCSTLVCDEGFICTQCGSGSCIPDAGVGVS